MNTAQLHVVHESFPNHNVGGERCSTLFLTITVTNLDRFCYFCIIGNMNEYSTTQIQIISLQPDYVSTLLGKTKNDTKTADRLCSAFC